MIYSISHIDCIERASKQGFVVKKFVPKKGIREISSAIDIKGSTIYINEKLRPSDKISETYKCVCQILTDNIEELQINWCEYD